MIDKIMQYENGELDDSGTLKLFSELVKTGQCWSLQGHYGRTASYLIDSGLLDKKGTISWDIYDELLENS